MRLCGTSVCSGYCHHPKFILTADSFGLGINAEINPHPISCKRAVEAAISHLANIICSITYIYLSTALN